METDVLVIGGGAIGGGVAWDLALRGARVILVEMGDLATGTSGRYHGLLHSGGRYAVKDPESARECIDENRILRRVTPHVLEDTGGLFILCPGDGDHYAERWLEACASVGIPTAPLTITEARRREPIINPEIRAAYEVPDATCDSWDLAHALQRGAEIAGGVFLTYHRVDDFLIDASRVTGALVTNLRTGEQLTISAQVVVNAAGPWAAQVARKAGASFNMKLSRGAMLAFNARWCNTVINRLRAPGDGDIFVPVGTVSVAGTTSVKTDDPGDNRVDAWEVERILSETEVMTPGISRARILRAWGGVRPLYDPVAGAADDRGAARTFTILDHSQHDGIDGLVSIIGGKLTTYRLMAERTADIVCQKIGMTIPSLTSTTVLPRAPGNPNSRFHTLRHRLDRLEHGETPGAVICECELITAPQIMDALQRDDVFTLNDLRRDLRLGMGPCQGGFCAYRAAALRHEVTGDSVAHTEALLTEFVERRFGGVKPLLWGHNLRQALLSEHIYARILGVSETRPAQHVPTLPTTLQHAPHNGDRPRIVVVGAGLAGLTAALAACDAGARVELAAFGQGALPLHPGWIETGDVEALSKIEGHPYAHAATSLVDGLSLIDQIVGLTAAPIAGAPIEALTALGRTRPVAFAAGGSLHALVPGSRVVVIGIDGWRDFYARLIADTLRAGGFDADAHDVRLHERLGNFDEWSVDAAALLDTDDGLTRFLAQVKPLIGSAHAAAFPAVLGFRRETRKRIAEAIGVPVLEVPTLPPSVPGLRLYHALRTALLERGGRLTLGARATRLLTANGSVTGVETETANGRPRVLHADAVILATGGLFGGGLDSDYQRLVTETVASLPVARVTEDEWFSRAFLSGKPQPIHDAGISTDAHLRPLDANGSVIAPNLYAAGRLLAGYSPVSEGCTEGVDIATGVQAARHAVQNATTAYRVQE